ncbi:MAG: LCP family protein [Clostridiales bacterium]|nr:LCP family protein [Clostridiales bacterium]
MIKKILKGCLIVLLVTVILLIGYYLVFIQNSEINKSKTATPIEDFTYSSPSTEEDLMVDEVLNSDGASSFNDIPDFEPMTINEANKIKLRGLVEESSRLNIVLFSHDGVRADTIIFISFDPVSKKINAINIPRDTYWRVKGYTSDYGNQKINAVYGRGSGLGGSKGVKEAIANLLQVPVHYVVKIDYEGTEAIINSIDGIEINVEHDMIYDDVWADPPLHIDIKEGFQVLDGHNAVDYLRWRKNNGELGDGDLPRIRRMQKFADSVLNKVISPKFPELVGACFKYIYTDMEFDLALSYALKATGVKSSNITFKRLPGDVKGYFYVMDVKKTQELLIDTYGAN